MACSACSTRRDFDADQVRDDLQQYILTPLLDPEAVLMVDETGFLKKGKKSVGVAAQYTGDTVSGGDYNLRSWLEERLQPYVLAVPKNQRSGLTHRADEVVASWEAARWQRFSAGEGSQGPRLYDWAWQELSFRWTEPGWKQWRLSRRRLSDSTQIAYSFVFAPESVSLEQVVRAAGSRGPGGRSH